MARILFGPCDDQTLFDRFLRAPVENHDWTVFGATARPGTRPARVPGRAPETLVLWASYASIPAWVWAAPVPLVVLAPDANLLWHAYRHLVPAADLVLTDAPAAARLRRAGIEHVRAANLFGLDRHLSRGDRRTADGARAIDVLFVGNINPAVQAERLPWLGRLARLGARYKVVITAGVFGAEYRAVLLRGAPRSSSTARSAASATCARSKPRPVARCCSRRTRTPR